MLRTTIPYRVCNKGFAGERACPLIEGIGALGGRTAPMIAAYRGRRAKSLQLHTAGWPASAQRCGSWRPISTATCAPQGRILGVEQDQVEILKMIKSGMSEARVIP